ncbi:MAG TPA: dicarboxylate/amino acid:cation symporter [Xanthomonadaceae bacterium]|nr:dicarboxylate/amino acid:cation symporter [Xanthomonadaceae bacterium]
MTETSRRPTSLSAQIIIGLAAGAVVGALVNLAGQAQPAVHAWLTEGLFHVVGQLFIAALMMLVVPLVFLSLVTGTSKLSDPKRLGRLGLRTLALYLATTAIAVTFALSLALLFDPGKGADLPLAEYTPRAAPSLMEVLIGLVPRNPVQAMADGNMLQIIVFSILVGLALVLAGETGRRVSAQFEDWNEIVMKLVGIVMKLAPYGVFALIAKLAAETGLASFKPLLAYFLLVLSALLLHAFVTYPLLLKALSGLNPLIFLRKMRTPQLFAFSTASSNATIPVTLRTVERNIGVHNSVASFTVPLGATINMDGTAIMQGVAVVFLAQVYGMDLNLAQILMVVLMATLASVGTAGVPGVGMIMLGMVLVQVGLPPEAIGFIIGIDRLLDMVRTAVNITGDAMVTTVVAKWEGELDELAYEDPDAGMSDDEGAPSESPTST